jgi:serine/threonine protein kinase
LLPDKSDNEEAILRLIESQSSIDERFFGMKRIDECGGDGSFSYVFTANDKQSKKNRKVAIKILKPLANEYREKCFHREADLLKELRGQRNILLLAQEKKKLVITLSEGIPLTLWYYVSILGKYNIRHYIYEMANNYLLSIQYFRQMCKAVQRIHRSGICHRDLKPGNFIAFAGRYVCLSDFGTAKHIGGKEPSILDSYSGPVGELRYTAPELLCGLGFSDRHIICADMYSLGAVLFELFTKTALGAELFRDDEILGLIRDFHTMPENRRIRVFNDFIRSYAESKRLFSIRNYDDSIPANIAKEVDKLYQALADLNYEKRLADYQLLFLRINIIEKGIRIHIAQHKKRKRSMKLKMRSAQ